MNDTNQYVLAVVGLRADGRLPFGKSSPSAVDDEKSKSNVSRKESPG